MGTTGQSLVSVMAVARMLSSGSHMVLMVSSSSRNRQEHRLTEAQPLVGGRWRRGLDFFPDSFTET